MFLHLRKPFPYPLILSSSKDHPRIKYEASSEPVEGFAFRNKINVSIDLSNDNK